MIFSVGIAGYSGRMGQAIAQIIEMHPAAALMGGIVRTPQAKTNADGQEMILTDNPVELFSKCDVVIDFSHPSVTPIYAKIAADLKKPFMSGTTGLDDKGKDILREVSQTIPLLYATNTSLSLVVAKHMAKLGAQLLKDQDYDISILDKHHRWKKDAPSGTALTLGMAVTEGNGGSHPPTYASLRTGAVVGEHEVMFAGPGETIIMSHSVTDRRVFARGAVQAALWLAGQKTPGLYGMDDVLGI